MLTAFAPMAFFFSAVYSESLYLALSVGLFWSARNGRWAWVGVLGALAAATRSTGLVLLLPALMIYLYGPREDRPADFARAARGRLRARYRVRRDILWLGLLPLGVVAYGAYLALSGGDALAPLRAQNVWGRHFAGPYRRHLGRARRRLRRRQAAALLPERTHLLPGRAREARPSTRATTCCCSRSSSRPAVAVAGVLKTLPLAYGAYVIAALALPLSDPGRGPAPDVASAVSRRAVPAGHLVRLVAGRTPAGPAAGRSSLSACMMAFFAAEFSTWHWVA